MKFLEESLNEFLEESLNEFFGTSGGIPESILKGTLKEFPEEYRIRISGGNSWRKPE